MANEQVERLCMWMIGFSLVLGACGGPAAEASREGGPVAEKTRSQPPTAQHTQRAAPDIKAMEATAGSGAGACEVSEPVWAKPPEDAAVPDTPGYGYYYVNADGSMWASAWWTGAEGYDLRAGEEGNKVGWFRPEGAPLEISGRRLDAKAPPLDAHVPCCYPTRFQATGLIFPTEGCWEVTARAEESRISFVVWVGP